MLKVTITDEDGTMVDCFNIEPTEKQKQDWKERMQRTGTSEDMFFADEIHTLLAINYLTYTAF